MEATSSCRPPAPAAAAYPGPHSRSDGRAAAQLPPRTRVTPEPHHPASRHAAPARAHICAPALGMSRARTSQLCGDGCGGSLRRPSARRGGSGDPCPANTDICRYWRFKPWTASVDRGKPLYNTSRGLQPAHLFAADVAAVATVTAAAVTAATTAHAAPLAALRTSPHPSPVIPRSAERVVRGPRLPALLPLHQRCPPASPPASPRHLCLRRLRRLLLRHRHRRPLHHPPHHSTPATPLPPPRPPPPSPPAGRAWAALTGMPGANPGGLPPRRVFCCNLVCA